ncbi:hypothetical protein CYG49_00060 [Candidatus Saccharibacteria bacterium]|nr:MAG: hypothetical protein CYG49_00060 [Candidatus Saccharibacteria bacterium]
MSDLRFFPLERGSGTRVDGRPVLPQDLFAMVLPEGLLQAVKDSARKERRPGSSPHNRPGTKGGRIQRQRTQSDGTTD